MALDGKADDDVSNNVADDMSDYVVMTCPMMWQGRIQLGDVANDKVTRGYRLDYTWTMMCRHVAADCATSG